MSYKTYNYEIYYNFKHGILLFGISLICISCQKDDSESTSIKEINKSQIKLVSENDMPQIVSFLKANTSFTSKGNTSKTLNSKNSSINIENALQVIDSLGNINHTFYLTVEDNNETTFYNLVVHQNSIETTPNAYVFKYEIDIDYLQAFIDGGLDFSNFNGSIKRMSLSTFLNTTNTSQLTSKDSPEVLTKTTGDCVCEETTVTSSGTSGGSSVVSSQGGSATSSGSGSSSGTVTNCSTTITSNYVIDGESGNTGGSYDGIAPQVFVGWTITTWCNDGTVTQTNVIKNKTTSTKIEDDCTNPCADNNIGKTPILTGPVKSFSERQVLAALGLRSGSLEYNWWISHPDEATQIRNFLNEHWNGVEFSPEAEEFAESAIDTWKENKDAEINFEDKIINELSGKEKCLHYLLNKNGSTYIQDLISKFKGNSEFDIKIISKDKIISAKTGKEVNGITSGAINGIITISINSSKANTRSALGVARTILHEYIHADIQRKLKTKSPSDGDKEFRDIFDQYGKDHHEAMASLYINSMRDALKHFHKNVLTDDYNKYANYYEEAPNNTFYEALAWRGLKEHNVKAWTDLTSSKKQELENLSIRVDVLTKPITCP